MDNFIKSIYDKINDNVVNYDKTKGIIAIFKEICKKHGKVIALRYKERSYTYEEVDTLTDTIAWNILNAGIAEKSRIGIYMDKDERYVISILSILKSNCIYVPISKIYPNERVASILKSSKAKAMIVDRESSWMNQHGIFILNYDDLLANEKEKFIYNDMKCELEAYILFTSGSTGMPKGILVRQHSVVNLINSMAKELIEDNHKVKTIGILSQFVFDVSVAQMYLALLTGNTLEIICDDIRFEPEKLMQFFKDVHMDICEFTPMYLDMLVKYCEINKKNLFLPKYVLNIGEALPYGLAKRVLELKDIEIFNYYGPTEVTVYATYFRINRNNIDKLYDILIGRPINNVQIYIFDNKMNLCDIGEEGELYIAGDGVTNGYVSNEEITKKSFIKNIYDEKMMMYKTGDIVKLTKSGDIQYIGRMDDQIKVRGFRIELKEIEEVIKKIDKIKEVKVLTCNEGTNKIIVAYYISDEILTMDYFTSELSRSLPYYMIPTCFVPVEKFEKNINGKLDKKKLPDYKKYNINEKNDKNYNYSDIEHEILEICRELLKHKTLGMEDNFYSCGGNSLIFMELNSIINQKWNINIPTSELYRCKTIKDIAEISDILINKNKIIKDISNKEKKLVISEFQRRLISLERNGTSDMSENNIVHVVYFDNYIYSNRLSKALDKLVENQNILQSRFYIDDGVPMMDISDKCQGYFEKIYTEENLNSENLVKYRKKIDIENEPVFKLILLENKNREQAMVLNIHHAVFDLMSFDIFIDQLMGYYNGNYVKKLEYDFFDYMNYVRKKDKTEMKSFWRNYLFGRHNAVCFNIKSKKIRITNKDRDIFEKSYFKIEGDTLQKLGKCCRNWCVTEYILLISAISLLLAKNTNCKDVIIGTYVPGRDNTDHIPTNNIIGLFTKMFPFRFNIEGKLSFKEYVKLQMGNFSKLLEYQESTQDEIYGALEFEDLIKGQLFNLVFNYIFEYERQIDKFKIKSTEIGNEPKVFPYYITAVEKKDCIVINTTYLKKIYSKEDIKIIEDEFKNIISKILHNEDCIISNML